MNPIIFRGDYHVSPFAQAVVTIGSIQSGEAPNVVNEFALMKLTVRTLDVEARKLVLEQITNIAKSQAAGFGASVEIKHINGSPVLVNGKEATEFARKVGIELVGEDKVHQLIQFMGSEDFAFMLEANPNGSYLMIGSGDQEGYCNVHNPGYDFND